MTDYDGIVINDLKNGYLEIHTDVFDELRTTLKGHLTLFFYNEK